MKKLYLKSALLSAVLVLAVTVYLVGKAQQDTYEKLTLLNQEALAYAIETDTDGDGIPDYLDPDIDNDGIPNEMDDDANGNGIPDNEEGIIGYCQYSSNDCTWACSCGKLYFAGRPGDAYSMSGTCVQCGKVH